MTSLGVALRNNGYSNAGQIFNDVDLGVIRDRKLKKDAEVQERTLFANVRYARRK